MLKTFYNLAGVQFNKTVTRTARRCASVSSVKYIKSQTPTESEVYQKYQEKLLKKAEELGAKDLDELKTKLKDEIEKKKKELGKVDVLAELDKLQSEDGAGKPSNVIKIHKPLEPTKVDKKPPFKTLESYIAVDKIKDLPSDQISLIWRARFQAKERTLCSVVPKDLYMKLHKTARENSNFVLPLKREGQGHELHFVQWSFTGEHTTHVIMTTLAEYKLNSEFAKPHTTLTFHQELKDDKDIVLMNGTIEENSNVTMSDAQKLILNLQNFYGALDKDNNNKLKLLRGFNKNTGDFSLDLLIKESQDIEQ